MIDLPTLSARIGQLAKTLTNAKARRSELALAAIAGDKAALKEVADIDARLTVVQREVALVNDAIEQTKKLNAEQQAEMARKQKAKCEKETTDAAAVVLSIDEEIDKALVQLREMFERRRTAVQALGATGVIPSYNIGRCCRNLGRLPPPLRRGYASTCRWSRC